MQNKDIQISKNFWLSELIHSQTATRYKIKNYPNIEELTNLELVTINILQKVRDYYNKPVIISSGFRSKQLNTLIGGSKTSQHMKGQAVDFIVPSLDNYEVADWISKNLKYDQLILEFYNGGNSGWIHASWSPNLRMQNLTINHNGVKSGLIKL